MREMKDSGIEWIGDVPRDWEIVRVKEKYSFNTGFTPDTQQSNYYNDENGYEWATITDIVGGKVSTPTKSLVSRSFIEQYHKKIIKPNSLLYSFKLSVGQTAITDRPMYTNEALASFEQTSENNISFFKYSSMLIEHNANTNIYGAKILNQQLIKNAYVTFPSLQEQRRIADFLDEKCDEIDSLTKDIQEQIETLEAYKKSVITEAVTKGLDPNIEMKDSGIEWIGEVPNKWSLVPFKYLLSERSQKNNPIISDERLSLSIGLGVTLYADKTTNLDRFKEDVSQYKITHKGDLVMNSMNMIVGAVGVSPYFGCVSPAYYTFYDNEIDNIYTRFCEYIFLTPSVKSLLYKMGKGILAIDKGEGQINTCRLKVSKYDLGKLILPCPPSNEIRNLLNYLDTKCSEIDAIIQTKKEQLDTLNEYKKSLIYEYVTVKKEVK